MLVVGGGFSGTLLVVHLLRSGRPFHVTWADTGGRFGPGLAFGTPRPEHLLNVPAGGMSAFPEAPDDFVRFVAEHGGPADPEAFLPRAIYGAYLTARLREAVAAARPEFVLQPVNARVLDLHAAPGRAGHRVRFEGGVTADVDRTVLAWGNLPPLDPLGALAADLGPDRYARDAWGAGALEGLAPEAPVLVLGTGLTAIDVVLTLANRGHRGTVLALSRRGRVPLSHRREGQRPTPETYLAPMLALAPILAAKGSARGILRAMRREAKAAAARGGDWRDVMTAVRLVTPALWTSLDGRQRAQFLRHLRPFWDTHRHRMAEEVASAFHDLQTHRRVRVAAGRVVDVEERVDGVRVRVRRRGGGTYRVLVGRLVNATGACTDLARSKDPLVASLLHAGLVRADPLGLGLWTDERGAVLAADGVPATDLHALGPLLQGALWESTAVPETRDQARDLAAHLVRTA